MQSASNAKEEILKYSIGLFDDLFLNNSLDCDFEKKGISHPRLSTEFILSKVLKKKG